jgi:predicted nuclease of predicted toxin-antitoxin system
MTPVRLKLDENLNLRCALFLRDAGHDVVTVPEQGLCSAKDRDLIGKCGAEDRCLVTLDMEFGSPLLYDPSRYAGIALIRLPPKASQESLERCLDTLVKGLTHMNIHGKLWIIQLDRIREYQPDEAGERP